MKEIEAANVREDRKWSFSHIPALDGLRGIAILLVVIHNSAQFGDNPRGAFYLAALVGSVGWIGVQLFFVLSGFLITSKLLSTQHASNYYSTFFGRRILRIFPLYYAALTVGFILIPLFRHTVPFTDRLHQIWLWTFTFNWAHPLGTPAYGFPHFWSLAVEEQFYLIWPFVVHRCAPQSLARVCYALIATAFVVRIIMALAGADSEMIYEFTISRMDALAAGALLAALLNTPAMAQWLRKHSAAYLPIAGAIVLIGALSSRLYTRTLFFTQSIGYTILAVFFALILLACILGENRLNTLWQRFLSTHPLRSVGKYSFAMYVFHFPIESHLEKFVPQYEQHLGSWSGVGFVTTVGTISYIAAFCSYHLFEKHFLRLKSSFTPRTRTEPKAELLRHA